MRHSKFYLKIEFTVHCTVFNYSKSCIWTHLYTGCFTNGGNSFRGVILPAKIRR